MVNGNFKNDEQALLKLADGDLAAYRYLFDRYFSELCNFLRIYLHSNEFSEEVALEIYEYVWEKRETLQIKVNFKSFLFASAKNRAINHYRREHKAIFTSLDLIDPPLSEDLNTQNFMEQSELRSIIESAINKLPGKSRQIFLMAREDNLSHKEIAAQLGISPKTVENHVGIALHKLRESLRPFYKQIFITGSPEERYARASQFWNSKDPSAQSTAIKIWQRMTSEGVPYAKPYLIYGNYLSAVDPRGNCDEIVELRRRLIAIEPENIEFKDYLAGSLFLEGKLLWDDGNNSAAFESYIEGLHHFLDTGQVMSKAAPVTARIAFCACRMFSKQALERDSNADLGVRFFDWCERAGIDANEDIDISDARTK